MSDPISSTTAITLTIGSVTMSSMLQGHAPVAIVLGALTGSLIYILSLDGMSSYKRIGYFFVSFFSGIIGASPATDFLEKTATNFLEYPVVINQSLGAIVAAAIAVRLLLHSVEKISTIIEGRLP